MKKIHVLICCLLGSLSIQAQELLTVKDAIEIALIQNYDIQLSKNEKNITSENVSYGAAGFMPTVTASATQSNSILNLEQTQSNGQVRSLKNAKNNSLNYGINVGWTVFDGLGMFKRYDMLKQTDNYQDIQYKQSVLATISNVMATYYNIVEQTNVFKALESVKNISLERYNIAESRFIIGKASRLEVLNAQVNLNEDDSKLIRQANTIKALKVQLNTLLARDLEIDFVVDEQMNYDQQLNYATLYETAMKQNPEIMKIEVSRRISELNLKQIKSKRYPTVRVNAGYSFSETESSLGFATHSKSNGLNYGFTVAMNLFDGSAQNRSEKIAKMNIESMDLLVKNQNQQLSSILLTAFNNYQTFQSLVKVEENNVELAKRSLDITNDKFKIGTVSSVEFRDSQENYINAVSRYNAALLDTKLAEIELKQIMGKLDV